MAKSVIGVRTSRFGPRPVFGFAMDETEEKAAKRSRYEVLERVHAYYDVYILSYENTASLLTFNWESHQPCGRKPAGEVLLAHPQQAGQVDANGLAWHTLLEEAVSHGLLELAERHLNALIWYEGKTLCRLSTNFVGQHFRLDVYTTMDRVPYAMACISSTLQGVFVCGSSVALSLEHASRKAAQEAFMLLDGILHNDSGGANSESSRNKLLSMRDASFIEPIMKHLGEQVTQSALPAKTSNLKDIMRSFEDLNPDDAHYCVLNQEDGAVAIKAFWPGALNPKFHPSRGMLPEDPFC